MSPVLVLDTASGNTIATHPAGHTAMAPVLSPDERFEQVHLQIQLQHMARKRGFRHHWKLDISTSSTSLITTKMIEVGAFEAKTHLSKLLDAVENGDRVFITRHGKRIAELCPVKKNKKARFGCAKGPGFYIAPDFDAPLDDFKEYS